jgi:uncharacterized protein (TIGR00369 family)
MSAAEVDVAALQALLSEDSAFARAFGFQVRTATLGECVLAVPFNPLFERPGGIVSGQVLMAAADVAMWLAIKTMHGIADESVTINMQTSFIRSARQEGIVCRARVIKSGASLSHGTAECLTENGALLSHHTLTYMRPGQRGMRGTA